MVKIIYTDMVGDLFHANHVKLLKEASEFGDKLYVGVHSDEVVAGYKRKPVISMQNRIFVIESCKYVDKVIANAPLKITEEYINKYNIDLVIHSHLIEDNDIYEHMYKIPVELNKFKRLDYHDGISTTKIIKRILSDYKH